MLSDVAYIQKLLPVLYKPSMEMRTEKLRVIREEQDSPWSKTGSFVVQHCVIGAFSRFL